MLRRGGVELLSVAAVLGVGVLGGEVLGNEDSGAIKGAEWRLLVLLCFFNFCWRSRDELGLWFLHGLLHPTSTTTFFFLCNCFFFFPLRRPLSRMRTEVGVSLPFPPHFLLF